MSDETWWWRAACRGMNPMIFFPTAERQNTVHLYDTARTFCDRCPVRPECLDDALGTENTGGYRHGFRGGMTPDQRDHEVRRRRTATEERRAG